MDKQLSLMLLSSILFWLMISIEADSMKKTCNRCRGAGPIPSPTGDPCEKCECKCGQVQCSKITCDVDPPCMPEFWITEEGSCCPVCQPCTPGESVESKDPCTFCHCTSEPSYPIACAIMDCFCFGFDPEREGCDCPGLEFIKGKCCPQCPDCDGVRCPHLDCPAQYWEVEPSQCCAKGCQSCKEGDVIPSPDPCHSTCFCEDNKIKCSPISVHCLCGDVIDCECSDLAIQETGACCQTCPVVDCRLVRCARPDCPEEAWFKEPNACCYRCLNKKECEIFQIKCPELPCFESNQVQGKDDCCPQCGCEHAPSADKDNCIHLAWVTDSCGNQFCPDCIDGFDPNPDPCVGCMCDSGEWSCYIVDCMCDFLPEDPSCSCPGLYKRPGQCCHECAECEPNTTFKPDACTTCTCDEIGKVTGCVGTPLSTPEGCPPSVWIFDQCGVPSCPMCISGDTVPSNRPCNEGCFCNDDGSVSCFELAIDCFCGFIMECTCPGLFVPKGECCPMCPEDCTLVTCPTLQCPVEDQVRDEGSCCDRCKDARRCEGVTCNNPGCPSFLQVTWPGNCCPSCKQ